ncbi:hypothetical protein A1O3_03867 [Capronia epimyces CBS 606.96]|uniref:Uncharacterized protein n=1 Tax=Capronia epimyces CBS 606.96 TaxID=1182542 RepID=W9Y355_9EURO|nr:uncharacterized protein A1O3_03867 [Capronia epimyces CBS 606.96]EXJ86913.1 hypothetical protein A1O3_03867 [Capronia epimyces CBS 606.96]
MSLPQQERRWWTKAEDEQLKRLIAVYGCRRGRSSDSKWAEISKHFPGRTNKDCRKRWFHSLDPSIRKGGWTEEEDKIILDAYERLGPSWKAIAALLEGRKDDQVSKRYIDVLAPSVKDRLSSWTAEEDSYLVRHVSMYGHRWAAISNGLPGRPPLTCRNRWRRLQRLNRGSPPSEDTYTEDLSSDSPARADAAKPRPSLSTSVPASSLDSLADGTQYGPGSESYLYSLEHVPPDLFETPVDFSYDDDMTWPERSDNFSVVTDSAPSSAHTGGCFDGALSGSGTTLPTPMNTYMASTSEPLADMPLPLPLPDIEASCSPSQNNSQPSDPWSVVAYEELGQRPFQELRERPESSNTVYVHHHYHHHYYHHYHAPIHTDTHTDTHTDPFVM